MRKVTARIFGYSLDGVIAAEGADAAVAVGQIGGGLRVKLRQLRTGGRNPAWRDALAVFSAVATRRYH